KHLLADVREVVSEMRQDDALDLTQALKGLIEGVPALAVHLGVPPRIAVEDPRRAQILSRCVQAIVANAVRHADARNLCVRCARAVSCETRDGARVCGVACRRS